MINDNLVPSWNRSKPKFMAFLHMILQPLEDIRALLESYLDAFDLDSAAGDQLDILGALVGADRVLPFAPYSGSRTLSDDDYRLLIRATVARNVWSGTNIQIMKDFSTLFPEFGIVMEDNQDGSINLVLSSIQSISDLRLEMLNAGLLVPVPAGILLTYEIPETVQTASVTIQAGVYTAGQIQFSSVHINNALDNE